MDIGVLREKIEEGNNQRNQGQYYHAEKPKKNLSNSKIQGWLQANQERSLRSSSNLMANMERSVERGDLQSKEREISRSKSGGRLKGR